MGHIPLLSDEEPGSSEAWSQTWVGPCESNPPSLAGTAHSSFSVGNGPQRRDTHALSRTVQPSTLSSAQGPFPSWPPQPSSRVAEGQPQGPDRLLPHQLPLPPTWLKGEGVGTAVTLAPWRENISSKILCILIKDA